MFFTFHKTSLFFLTWTIANYLVEGSNILWTGYVNEILSRPETRDCVVRFYFRSQKHLQDLTKIVRCADHSNFR